MVSANARREAGGESLGLHTYTLGRIISRCKQVVPVVRRAICRAPRPRSGRSCSVGAAGTGIRAAYVTAGALSGHDRGSAARMVRVVRKGDAMDIQWVSGGG